MTELLEELTVVGDPVSDEDRVVHLLASLPDSCDMLASDSLRSELGDCAKDGNCH